MKKIIDNKEIIPKDDVADIESLMANTPDDQSEFVYQKFTDAKKQIEDVYIAIAFKNSTDGQALIKTVLESIKK